MKKEKKISFNDLVDNEIKEYKERTDIYENKKKVQIIYLDLTTDDFYKEYSSESLLKSHIYDFIEDTYDVFVTNEKRFKLEIEYPSDMELSERKKIESLIAVHYAIECDEIRYDIKREFIIGSILLLLGLIVMFISYLIRKYNDIFGEVVQVVSYENEVLTVNLPDKLDFEIVKTDPIVKGDATSRKPATIETGYELQVPVFVGEGERIIVSTIDGSYVSRA